MKNNYIRIYPYPYIQSSPNCKHLYVKILIFMFIGTSTSNIYSKYIKFTGNR